MKCSTKKICFASREIAEHELLANHAKYNYAAGQGPVNIYKCDSCGTYHFTSKGEPHPLLQKKETQQQINRESEANYWLDKLK